MFNYYFRSKKIDSKAAIEKKKSNKIDNFVSEDQKLHNDDKSAQI